MAAKPDTIDIFFEMPLDKWQIFDSKTLSKSKVVLLHDLKPVVDMFNADGVGIGVRTASEVIREIGLSARDQQRLISLMSARSFDVYSVRAALNDHLTDLEAASIYPRVRLPDFGILKRVGPVL